MKRLLLLLYLSTILSSCKNDLTSNLEDLTAPVLQAKGQYTSKIIVVCSDASRQRSV